MNKITDAAVEAACEAFMKPGFTPMRAAIEAALLHLQPSPAGQAAHCPVKHCGMTYARVPADGRCHACGARVQPSPAGQGDILRAIGSNLRSLAALAEDISTDADGVLVVATMQCEIKHAQQLLEAVIASAQPYPPSPGDKNGN